MAAGSESVFKVVAKCGAEMKSLTPDEQRNVLAGLAALLGLPSPLTATTADPRANADPGKAQSTLRKASIVEFLKAAQPVTNPQTIAVFAAYREQVEGLESFSPDDLKPYFARAKLPFPKKNFFRDFNRAVRQGWIHDGDDKSYLTRTGEEAVSAGFDGKRMPSALAGAKN